MRLSRTADFDCSRSGSFKTDLGLRLRLFFAIPEYCTQALKHPKRCMIHHFGQRHGRAVDGRRATTSRAEVPICRRNRGSEEYNSLGVFAVITPET